MAEIKVIKDDKKEYTAKSIDTPFNTISSLAGLSSFKNDKYNLMKYGYESIVYSAINLIANTVAQQSFVLYKNGKEVKDNNDIVLKFLSKPNRFMSWYDFIYILQVMIDIFGERYIYKLRDKAGLLYELWIIPSWAIEPKFDGTNINLTHFEYKVDGKTIKYSPDDVIYDFYPSPSKINRGESPLSKIALEFDIHTFAKKYVRAFYKNGAVPFGLLTTDRKVTNSDIEEIKQSWNSKFQGIDKSWNIAILGNGNWKYQEIATKPSDEFINQSKWTVYDILTAFNIPPLMLNYTESINRTTAEVQQRLFAKYCIKPRLKKLEYLINTQIIPLITKENYQIKFDSPSPEDEQLNVQKAKVLSTFGIATVNEVRQLLGLQPIEDEYGDEFITPLNLPEGRPKKEDEKKLDNELLSMKDVIYEEFMAEMNQIDKAIKELLKKEMEK